jgi:hypothetical protein
MPGTRPGMTSFARKSYSIGCILSQTLKSHAQHGVSKDAKPLS